MPHTNRSFAVEYDRNDFNTICEKTIGCLDNYILETMNEGFKIKEKKVNLQNGTYAVTAIVSYVKGKITIDAKCGGLGPVQNKHVNQVADIISNFIKKGPSEGNLDRMSNDDIVRCPMCGCTQIELKKRGWNAGTGLLGSGKNERVCMKCLHRF